MKTFPLADAPNEDDRKQFGGAAFTWAQRGQNEGIFLRAVMSGEQRPPRKGEWYISGAIPEAYRAANDLSSAFQIASLVVVQREIKETILQ
jgi:hypothetical protein